MKNATLAWLALAATLSLSAAEAAPLRPDEPEAKEQSKKTIKAKKKHVPRANRKKESEFTRAMRRNELLREPAAAAAKP